MNKTMKNILYKIAFSAVASIILGIVAAFLTFTAVVAVTPAFLWVLFGIAVVYLGILLVASALTDSSHADTCLCSAINALLIGILGTVVLALVLLAVGIVATSVISAILVGFLLLFFFLILTSTACLIRRLIHCRS